MHAALTALSQSAPLLVLVEDVHWADQSTREMLSFLFSRRFAAPVSIVASYRSDDLHRRHPLRAARCRVGAAARCDPARSSSRCPMPTYARSSASCTPRRCPRTTSARIVARAEGNAFFTEELVAAAEMGGRSLPTDLADLLLVRLDQLDETARQVVRAASVAGRRVTHELLAHVVGLRRRRRSSARCAPPSTATCWSRSAPTATRSGTRCSPRRSTTTCCPASGCACTVPTPRALCDGDVDGTAAELARHARAAHRSTTAVTASIQAGDEAMAVGGPDEAARHYEVALELLADPTAQDGRRRRASTSSR